MIFNKKKFYTLLDIKNQIVFTPLIFIFILSIISFIIIYIFLTHEHKNKVEVIIKNEQFYLSNQLKNYTSNVKYNSSATFNDIENELSSFTYEIIGFLKANINDGNSFTFDSLKKFLDDIEKNNNIDFLVFDTKEYEVLYGENIIENLIKLTNSDNKTKNFRQHLLKNIEYIGDDNLMYNIDNEKRYIQLSYLKSFKNLNLFLGAYSKIDDMKILTKKTILDSLIYKSKSLDNAYFYFYDMSEKTVFNFENKAQTTNIEDIRNFFIKSNNDMFFEFPKYHFKIFIKSQFSNKELKKVKDEYQTKMIIGYLLVVFVALLLITSANIFGRFINTIFNRYNKRLERKNVLFRKWKERYELAIIASNDGLWDMNLKTKEIFFSNKWLDMFGFKRGEISNFNDWLNLIHKEDKNKVLREYEKHINKKSDNFVCEYRIKDKHGNYKWVLVRGKEFNSNRMLMMSMDINKRVQLAKDLKDVELLTELGRIVIFRWDNSEDLSVKFVSKSINTYGYEVEDFENSNIKFFDFVYKEDVKQLKNQIKKVFSENLDSFTNIYRVVNKHGNIKWVYNRTIVIRDDNRNIVGFYGYLNDITKIKTNEEELKIQVQKELEKNILKDRLLVQQNKLASMGEMLGNIAHQWRQPLNNINLIIHFLRDSYGIISKDDFINYVKDAKLQIEYMSQTIDDFRNFYKPSKNISTFNIKESILLSSKIVASSFEKNMIKLIVQGDDVLINNYENEFEQVIVNILNNAIDAKIVKSKTEKFDAYVKIDIKKYENEIVVSIFNNCGNIQNSIIDRVFEPYFTTKFENQGTGIGLYMSKIIIEKNMKGSIEVKNYLDGVQFEIRFKC